MLADTPSPSRHQARYSRAEANSTTPFPRERRTKVEYHHHRARCARSLAQALSNMDHRRMDILQASPTAIRTDHHALQGGKKHWYVMVVSLLALTAAVLAIPANPAEAETITPAPLAGTSQSTTASDPTDTPTTEPSLRHAIAMHGDIKYPDGFKHFAHVNPNAPKGGTIRLGILGSYDSLNPFIIRGVAAAGLRDFLFESLLVRGVDEPFTLYAGLANQVEMPDDRSSITFHIHPEAAFSDGHPVDADDLLFSWNTLRDRGRPNHRAYYAKVTKATKQSDRTVRFDLGDGSDRELPLILGLMPILPAHLLTPETFEQTTLRPPIGSGPYTVTKVEPGRTVTYTRNPQWWARDLPAQRGRFNFNEIRYEYFRDGSAMFEAFKSGQIDLRPEEAPSQWAEGYNVPAVYEGRLLKREFDIALPAGMTALTMNTRRKQFENPLVRQGLIELFDFTWVNQNLFHGLYTRTQSYFARSELSSFGEPADARERELLKPYANLLHPKILDGRYTLPVSKGDGRNREAWRRAMVLFRKAGYRLDDGKLRNPQTGQTLAFEMLAASTSQQRLFLAYARDLKRLGVDATVRIVDSAQYQSRLKTYDYDMIQTRWPSSLSPGNEQLFRWSSAMADRDGSFNFAGVKNDAVDAMIKAMLAAKTHVKFRSAVRALDRVLLSGHYVIPLFHVEKQWIAHWDRLKSPDVTPLFGYQLDSWWHAEAAPSN